MPRKLYRPRFVRKPDPSRVIAFTREDGRSLEWRRDDPSGPWTCIDPATDTTASPGRNGSWALRQADPTAPVTA